MTVAPPPGGVHRNGRVGRRRAWRELCQPAWNAPCFLKVGPVQLCSGELRKWNEMVSCTDGQGGAMGASKAGRGWGLGGMLIALACGGTSDPEGVIGDGGSSMGGTGAGGTTGGDLGMPSGGTGGGAPAHAPACATVAQPSASPPFINGVEVLGTPYWNGSSRARVVARGFGAPPELTELPRGATSADQLGWVRLVESATSGSGDAGTPSADAGDAGEAGVERVVVGPRELGELPVAIGAEVDLTNEFDGVLQLRTYHWRVVLRNDEHVLVFHQNTSMDEHLLGTFSGFTLERGDAVCASPVPNAERRCADDYHHELEVTVPGGMAATLTPWETRVLGSYRVRGSTSTYEHVLPRNPGVGDGCNDLHEGPTVFTAVRLAAQP
jgi:hypothetical protein